MHTEASLTKIAYSQTYTKMEIPSLMVPLKEETGIIPRTSLAWVTIGVSMKSKSQDSEAVEVLVSHPVLNIPLCQKSLMEGM